ncbi:hypothetical protein ACSFXN_07310 [Planococcus sp. 1R117A]|uniref:hypothetical protein n=1 Tax=Planococcus sp. 1R117A TaxID=3447020 RepID=UPI003EDBB20E
MKSIIAAWHSLFTNIPEKLKLTRVLVHSSNKKALGGQECLVFRRNDVVKLLERLLLLIKRLEGENPHLYHFEI